MLHVSGFTVALRDHLEYRLLPPILCHPFPPPLPFSLSPTNLPTSAFLMDYSIFCCQLQFELGRTRDTEAETRESVRPLTQYI